MEHSWFQRVQKNIKRIGSMTAVISAVTIVVMMLFTVVDVSLRRFGSGIEGYIELNRLMLVVVSFFAFAHTWNKDGHIRIDLLVNRFSPRAKSASRALDALAGLLLFGTIMWKGVGFAFKAYRTGEVSSDLLLPLFPVKALLLIGCSVFVFHLLISFIDFLCQAFRRS